MAVSQKDIAERAQVSRSLVARVLNDDATIQVSHSKRQLILKTASELGYRPNIFARSLRKGKTHAVLAVCQVDESRGGGSFMKGVLEMLAIELAQEGYELKVRVFYNVADTDACIEENASASACDAFVLWLTDDAGELSGVCAERRGIPFVIAGHYDAETHATWHQVDFDHLLMMRKAVRHLADCGKTRIAYVGFDNELNYARRLLSGYRLAMREVLDEPAREDWIYRVTDHRKDTELIAERWLQSPIDEQPTGVVIGAGTQAWAGIEIALARHGRRIGIGAGDLNVIGQLPGGQPLLYGHGLAFYVDQGLIASMAAKDLKRQLRSDAGAPLITRIVPVLTAVDSLALPLPNLPGPGRHA